MIEIAIVESKRCQFGITYDGHFCWKESEETIDSEYGKLPICERHKKMREEKLRCESNTQMTS